MDFIEKGRISSISIGNSFHFGGKRNATGGVGVPPRVLIFTAYEGGPPPPCCISFGFGRRWIPSKRVEFLQFALKSLPFVLLRKIMDSIEKSRISSISNEIPSSSGPKEMPRGGGWPCSSVGFYSIRGGTPTPPVAFLVAPKNHGFH